MENIKLGRYEEIPVYPQKWAYLLNRTSKTISKVISSTEQLELELSLGGSFSSWVGSSSYDLLVAMIPTVGKRMPKYEFAGYGSQEAYDREEYDEEQDNSPTVPEIIEAFNVAIRVNRFDLVKILQNIIDPKALKEPITKRLVDAISKDSQNLPQQNGLSPSTNFSMTDPTSKENGESLSQDSNSLSGNTEREDLENLEK